MGKWRQLRQGKPLSPSRFSFLLEVTTNHEFNSANSPISLSSGYFKTKASRFWSDNQFVWNANFSISFILFIYLLLWSDIAWCKSVQRTRAAWILEKNRHCVVFSNLEIWDMKKIQRCSTDDLHFVKMPSYWRWTCTDLTYFFMRVTSIFLSVFESYSYILLPGVGLYYDRRGINISRK